MAAEPLTSYLADLESLDATFEQRIHAADGELIEQLQGRMALLRPGRFRWEIQSPFRQLIVVDGEKLWLYDPELQQASVQDLADALAHTPAALLLEAASAQEYFDVAPAVPVDGGGLRVELRSHVGRDDYRDLQLLFMQGALTGIDFTDALDQRVSIRFSDMHRNEPGRPAAKEFRFVLPRGVDVVELSSP